MVSNNVEMCLCFVLCGFGIVCLFEFFVCDMFVDGRLCVVFDDYVVSCMLFYVLWLFGCYLLFKLCVFVDYMVEYLWL